MVGLLTDILCGYQNPGNLPPDREQCKFDPTNNAFVIIGVHTTLMGVLSCLTAAWWGSLSDRHGRTRVIALCGLPFIDVAWLVLALCRSWVPLGHYLVAVGYVAQGLVGGTTALMAVMLAYIADCTDATSRTVMFSVFLGASYGGGTVGGPLGRSLVRLVHQPSTVFALSAFVQVCLSACSWSLIPESVPPEQLAEEQRRHAEARVGRRRRGAMGVVDVMSDVVRPLGVVCPERDRQASGRWSLTLLAVAIGSFNVIASHSPYIALYSSRLHLPFNAFVDAMRFTVLARNIYLAICFPLIITALSRTSRLTSAPATVGASFTLNRTLAHVSAAFSAGIFAVFPLMTSVGGVAAVMVAGALGAGFNPAVLGLAVDVHAARAGARETGKVFGALGVVRAFSADILGPILIAAVYTGTLSTAPATLFVVASALMIIALIALTFVRMPEQRTRVLEDGV
ncbi:MFS general substrate transporter [Phanerochaete sordida]|uniref:MFS general substrate transporter n=1 Tax=Phanerochaete sordida TaxID=48140 RepID=A0A9P3LKJ0_9APHY|nr:MFS general substrate transporter [Phanerochaete sordida]